MLLLKKSEEFMQRSIHWMSSMEVEFDIPTKEDWAPVLAH